MKHQDIEKSGEVHINKHAGILSFCYSFYFFLFFCKEILNLAYTQSSTYPDEERFKSLLNTLCFSQFYGAFKFFFW